MQSKSVFISHNCNDKEFARRLAADLSLRGIRVWIDEGQINLGDSLIGKIREGIDDMDFLAVVLSPHSVKSEWVKREVDIAMNQEIEGRRVKVLPLLYKACDIPGFLKGKLYANFTDEERYSEGLMLLLERLGANAAGGKLLMFRKDHDGKFLYVNELFQKAHAPAEVVGKTDFDLFPREFAEAYRKSDLEVLRNNEAHSRIEQHKDTDGSTVTVHVIKQPFRNVDGQVEGVEGIYWTPDKSSATQGGSDDLFGNTDAAGTLNTPSHEMEDAIRAMAPTDLSFREIEITLSETWPKFREQLKRELPNAQIESIREDNNTESSFYCSGKPGHLTWQIVITGKNDGLPFSQRYDMINEWLHPSALKLAPANAGIPWDTSLFPVKDNNGNETLIQEADAKLRDATYWVLFTKPKNAG